MKIKTSKHRGDSSRKDGTISPTILGIVAVLWLALLMAGKAVRESEGALPPASELREIRNIADTQPSTRPSPPGTWPDPPKQAPDPPKQVPSRPSPWPDPPKQAPDPRR